MIDIGSLVLWLSVTVVYALSTLEEVAEQVQGFDHVYASLALDRNRNLPVYKVIGGQVCLKSEPLFWIASVARVERAHLFATPEATSTVNQVQVLQRPRGDWCAVGSEGPCQSSARIRACPVYASRTTIPSSSVTGEERRRARSPWRPVLADRTRSSQTSSVPSNAGEFVPEIAVPFDFTSDDLASLWASLALKGSPNPLPTIREHLLKQINMHSEHTSEQDSIYTVLRQLLQTGRLSEQLIVSLAEVNEWVINFSVAAEVTPLVFSDQIVTVVLASQVLGYVAARELRRSKGSVTWLNGLKEALIRILHSGFNNHCIERVASSLGDALAENNTLDLPWLDLCIVHQSSEPVKLKFRKDVPHGSPASEDNKAVKVRVVNARDSFLFDAGFEATVKAVALGVLHLPEPAPAPPLTYNCELHGQAMRFPQREDMRTGFTSSINRAKVEFSDVCRAGFVLEKVPEKFAQLYGKALLPKGPRYVKAPAGTYGDRLCRKKVCPGFDRMPLRGEQYQPQFTADGGSDPSYCSANLLCGPEEFYKNEADAVCKKVTTGHFSRQCDNTVLACTPPAEMEPALTSGIIAHLSHGMGKASGCGLIALTAGKVAVDAEVLGIITQPEGFSIEFNFAWERISEVAISEKKPFAIFGIFPFFYMGLLLAEDGRRFSLVLMHEQVTWELQEGFIASEPFELNNLREFVSFRVTVDRDSVLFFKDGALLSKHNRMFTELTDDQDPFELHTSDLLIDPLSVFGEERDNWSIERAASQAGRSMASRRGLGFLRQEDPMVYMHLGPHVIGQKLEDQTLGIPEWSDWDSSELGSTNSEEEKSETASHVESTDQQDSASYHRWDEYDRHRERAKQLLASIFTQQSCGDFKLKSLRFFASPVSVSSTVSRTADELTGIGAIDWRGIVIDGSAIRSALSANRLVVRSGIDLIPSDQDDQSEEESVVIEEAIITDIGVSQIEVSSQNTEDTSISEPSITVTETIVQPESEAIEASKDEELIKKDDEKDQGFSSNSHLGWLWAIPSFFVTLIAGWFCLRRKQTKKEVKNVPFVDSPGVPQKADDIDVLDDWLAMLKIKESERQEEIF